MNILNKGKVCSVSDYHIMQMREVVPSLSFQPDDDFSVQRAAIEKTFRQLVPVPEKRTNPVPLIEYTDDSDPRFQEIRFLVESEPGFFVPAHMLVPKHRTGKIPMVICLQGHAGMHISLGREAYPGREPMEVPVDDDFCIQAVARGYAAVAMEQRGFGELSTVPGGTSCHQLTWQAALMGKSLLGERIRDISALIDAVENGFEFVDRNRIGAMGNSGGGTSSYYAAGLDKRIKVIMPASFFSTYVDAWGRIDHCDCGYIPGILKYMELPDLAVMLAPRPLILVNGIHDPLQPIRGARTAFEKVKKIYAAAGAPENCCLIEGAGGHRFYAADAWPVFDAFLL